MQRLLAWAIFVAFAVSPASALAARDATASESAPFQSLTRTKACISGARISTYDGYWATTGATPCESSSTLYVLHQDGGVWSVVFIDDQYAVRACPIASVPDPVAIDLNLCNQNIKATPTPTPKPLPTATPTPTAAPTPGVAPTPGAAQPTSSSSAGSTVLLCLPSGGDMNRVAKSRPSSCNTLGPDDAFAEAANLAKLKWKGWGRGTATATGIERGFRSPASKIKVRVTASGLRDNDCGGRSYTKLKVKSKYGTLRQTLPASCGD